MADVFTLRNLIVFFHNGDGDDASTTEFLLL
jgi:hypothetical protein